MIACGTGYQNCSREIPIPWDCFVTKYHFLSNSNAGTTIAVVGRDPGKILVSTSNPYLANVDYTFLDYTNSIHVHASQPRKYFLHTQYM